MMEIAATTAVTPISPAKEKKDSETYPWGHDSAMLNLYQWRQVTNSAPHLIPYLRPGLKILDVGCGPGSITVDLAQRVLPGGHVTGVDYKAEPLELARALAQKKGITNVRFAVADVLDLRDFADASFDIVYAHQVVQHVQDPVHAIREMSRLVKPGGRVAFRESVSMSWYPELDGMRKWYSLYKELGKELGGHPDGGLALYAWTKEAGFDREDITCSAGVWCYNTPEERKFWGRNASEKTSSLDFKEKTVGKNICTEEELNQILQGWKDWQQSEDGWFLITHAEVVARKPVG
jgi:ubiquinone/menaquinone biosynthesis C-methylase UbiE